jgi:hypothetical protein
MAKGVASDPRHLDRLLMLTPTGARSQTLGVVSVDSGGR